MVDIRMLVLTIRNIPDDTYRALAARAQRNRRSLQQEASLLLERARGLERNDGLEKARAMREKLRGRDLGDVVRDVRDERAR